MCCLLLSANGNSAAASAIMRELPLWPVPTLSMKVLPTYERHWKFAACELRWLTSSPSMLAKSNCLGYTEQQQQGQPREGQKSGNFNVHTNVCDINKHAAHAGTEKSTGCCRPSERGKQRVCVCECVCVWVRGQAVGKWAELWLKLELVLPAGRRSATKRTQRHRYTHFRRTSTRTHTHAGPRHKWLLMQIIYK